VVAAVDPPDLVVRRSGDSIVAIVGSAVYGIGGALYSMALAVFALALFDEFDADPADLPTPLDDFDDYDRSAHVDDAAPSREAERGSRA